MSLIIKGMDMPEYCEACPCYDWKEDICRITESPNDFSDTRISDCPLAEIPTPHGRLIDADDLNKKLERHRDMCGDVETQYGINTAIRILNNTPSIIEAEVDD